MMKQIQKRERWSSRSEIKDHGNYKSMNKVSSRLIKARKFVKWNIDINKSSGMQHKKRKYIESRKEFKKHKEETMLYI